MVGALAKDEVGPVAGGQDALAEVRSVDRVPYLAGDLVSGLLGERSVLVEVGRRLLECRRPEEQEPLDVPAARVNLSRIDV